VSFVPTASVPPPARAGLQDTKLARISQEETAARARPRQQIGFGLDAPQPSSPDTRTVLSPSLDDCPGVPNSRWPWITGFSRKSALAKRLRCFPEVSDLCIEGALEGGPGRAAVDIGGEALGAGDYVGVLEGAEHRRHHEVTSREAVAVKIVLVAERFG